MCRLLSPTIIQVAQTTGFASEVHLNQPGSNVAGKLQEKGLCPAAAGASGGEVIPPRQVVLHSDQSPAPSTSNIWIFHNFIPLPGSP